MTQKYAFVFTVRREFTVPKGGDLDSIMAHFEGAVKDEPEEFLYGGAGFKEAVTVEMQTEDRGSWQTIYGDPR